MSEISAGMLLNERTVGEDRVLSGRSAWRDLGIVLGLYASMISFTKALSFGDTIFYAQGILDAGAQFQLGKFRQLLDFGHLLWRPLGWILLELARILNPLAHGDERILIIKILMYISVLSGAIASLFLYLICRQLGFQRLVSIVVCAVFIYCNAIVYSAATGSSYMLALAFLMGALWLATSRKPEENRPSVRKLWLAGGLLSLAAATWFPFILAAPAVALAPVIGLGDPRHSLTSRKLISRGTHLMVSSLAVGVIIFGGAAVTLDITNVGGIKNWISESAHGWRQTSNFLRLGMGLPRCCVAVTDDAGIPWKRFLFHDPFAPVRPRDLVQLNLIWMILFYFGLGLLLYTLIRNRRGRVFLSILLIAALPVLIFAVFLFEPSSIERYMPVFPFYFIALGYQLHLTWPNWKQRGLALIYPVVLVLSTLVVNNNHSVERHWSPARERLQMLKEEVPAGSTVGLLVNWDDIFLLQKDNPLEDNFSGSLVFSVILRPANERIFVWRERFASRVLEAWGTSSEMWVSDRLLARAPRPEWGWVEGDDRAIRWAEVPEFFQQFQFDKKIGDSDGFERLANVQANRALLDRLVSRPARP